MNAPKRILVKALSELKALQRAGHITLHAHTGKVVGSPFGDVKAWYIDTYKETSFEHRGHKYHIVYVDGCFNPFVYREITDSWRR